LDMLYIKKNSKISPDLRTMQYYNELPLAKRFFGHKILDDSAGPYGPIWCHFGLNWLCYTSKNIQNLSRYECHTIIK
jgi:hypothetical protein